MKENQVVFSHAKKNLIPGSVLKTLKSIGVLPISLREVFVLFSFLQTVLILRDFHKVFSFFFF